MHQASPVPNKWTKKSTDLGTIWHCLVQPTCPFFLTLLINFIVDTWVTTTTAWHTDEENPCLYNTHLWAPKGLNATVVDPWAPSLTKHLWWDFYKRTPMSSVFQYVENCRKPRSLNPTRRNRIKKSELTSHMFCLYPNKILERKVLRKSPDLEKLMCNPRQTNGRTKGLCPATCISRAYQEKNIIQIYMNIKALLPFKEQYGLSKCSQNARGDGQTKWQIITLASFI